MTGSYVYHGLRQYLYPYIAKVVIFYSNHWSLRFIQELTDTLAIED